MPNDTTPALPALPELPRHQYCLNSSPVMEGYTADQMREYATSALTAALARAAELERERDELRAALVELVDVELLQEKIAAIDHKAGCAGGISVPLFVEQIAMKAERRSRQALAWDAARAAVAGVPKPIQNPSLGHQAGLSIPGVRTEPGGSS